MKKGHKQCKDCLAYYDVHHTCDGLMKAIVQTHKRNEKHNRCGRLIHASEGTYCANPKPCKWHTPQSEEKKAIDNAMNQIIDNRENTSNLPVFQPHSSNGMWEENFDKKFCYKKGHILDGLLRSGLTREDIVEFFYTVLSSERTSMIGEMEKMRKGNKQWWMEPEAGTLVEGDVRPFFNGYNECLDQVINYLKNK